MPNAMVGTLPCPELIHFFEAELGVGDGRRQIEHKIGFGSAHLLNERGRVRQRRRESLVHDKCHAQFFEQMLPHRLDGRDRSTGIVGDDRYRLRTDTRGVFGKLQDDGQGLFGLRSGGSRCLEHVFEAALGDQVGIGQREDRQMRPLRHFGHREGERTEIGTACGDHVRLLRDHTLGCIFRFLRGVTAIEHHQFQLGASQSLDAARRIDAFDRPCA